MTSSPFVSSRVCGAARVAVALRAQVLLDPVARVLEQILVDRAFALDRHELGAAVGRQRIAGEHDAHVRARASTVSVRLATRSSSDKLTAGVILAS